MFTLKLYQTAPTPPTGRTVIMEVVGIWIDHCENGVKHVHAFKKTVGIQDEDGSHDFYVGGDPQPDQNAITKSPYGNYFDWGVLENAKGKTTEMLR